MTIIPLITHSATLSLFIEPLEPWYTVPCLPVCVTCFHAASTIIAIQTHGEWCIIKFSGQDILETNRPKTRVRDYTKAPLLQTDPPSGKMKGEIVNIDQKMRCFQGNGVNCRNRSSLLSKALKVDDTNSTADYLMEYERNISSTSLCMKWRPSYA